MDITEEEEAHFQIRVRRTADRRQTGGRQMAQSRPRSDVRTAAEAWSSGEHSVTAGCGWAWGSTASSDWLPRVPWVAGPWALKGVTLHARAEEGPAGTLGPVQVRWPGHGWTEAARRQRRGRGCWRWVAGPAVKTHFVTRFGRPWSEALTPGIELVRDRGRNGA